MSRPTITFEMIERPFGKVVKITNGMVVDNQKMIIDRKTRLGYVMECLILESHKGSGDYDLFINSLSVSRFFNITHQKLCEEICKILGVVELQPAKLYLGDVHTELIVDEESSTPYCKLVKFPARRYGTNPDGVNQYFVQIYSMRHVLNRAVSNLTQNKKFLLDYLALYDVVLPRVCSAMRFPEETSG